MSKEEDDKPVIGFGLSSRALCQLMKESPIFEEGTMIYKYDKTHIRPDYDPSSNNYFDSLSDLKVVNNFCLLYTKKHRGLIKVTLYNSEFNVWSLESLMNIL